MPSKLDQYTVTKTLGKGASALVKLGTTSDGKRVALKIFDKQNPKNTLKALNALKNEVDSFRLLNHPYMVNLIDFKEHAIWVKPEGNVAVAYMALELIEGGELFDYVALKAFSVPTCRYYFKQMLQVLHYVHFSGVAHRDLKPENIMLDQNFNIRFADFGFAAPIEGRDGSGFLRTNLGTTAYMAPELIMRKAYQGNLVDLFAIGIILFILHAGHPPFSSANPESDPHYKLLCEGKADHFWRQHQRAKPMNFFSEEFKDLITNMLQPDPAARLSLADCIGHAWMKGPVAQAVDVRLEFAQRARQIALNNNESVVQKSKSPREAVKKAGSPKNEAQKKTGSPRTIGGSPRAIGTGKPGRRLPHVRRSLELFELKQTNFTLKPFSKDKFRAPDTYFFSSYSPSYLFETIQMKLKERDIDMTCKPNKLKIVFEQSRESQSSEEGQIWEGAHVRIQIKVTEVDSSRVAVEFQKLAGSAFFFREQLNKLRVLLKQFNDVEIDVPEDFKEVKEEAKE